jgi:membrane-associated protease RseP (regulator of RpoE activity)
LHVLDADNHQRTRVTLEGATLMSTLRSITLLTTAFVTLSAVASAQVAAPQTTTVTTTTSHLSASPDLNTNTNSGPDITGWSGHPDTDMLIRSHSKLTVAMANFSVRTGIEIRPNRNAQVVVQSVRPQTPAARAGVEPGDVISKIDGDEVASIGAFQQLIQRRPTKPAFLLTLRRGDQSYRAPLGRQLTLMGMTVFPDAADRPVVAAVDRSSPAEFGGFQVGDIIVGLNRQTTATMDRMLDFGIPYIRSVAVGQGLAFMVAREGKVFQLSITRPADADLPPLSPDQERHLRRLGMGGVPVEAPRHVIGQSTTTMTTTIGPVFPGAVPAVPTAVVPTEVPVGVPGGPPMPVPYNTTVTQSGGSGAVVGFETLGLGLPTGNVEGVGAPATAAPGPFGPLHDASGAVAVLYGKPSNLVHQTLMPRPHAPVETAVTATTPGMNAGVVGFVQIQALAPTKRSAPRDTKSGEAPAHSIVSARVTGIPTGVYTLAINQYGDCGDAESASPGAPVITLGTIVVDANGQGQLRPQNVAYMPQDFLGRVTSLVPSGAVPAALPPGQPQNRPAAAEAPVRPDANLVACGVFGLSNPRRPYLGASMAGVGVPGTTVTTGAPAPAPPAPVPTTSAPPQPQAP